MTAHKTGRGGGAELGVYARLRESQPAWMDNAPCRVTPTAAFFPTRGQVADAALAVCAGCPHVDPCLTYALTHHERGIWGGTTEATRRRIRKEERVHAERTKEAEHVATNPSRATSETVTVRHRPESLAELRVAAGRDGLPMTSFLRLLVEVGMHGGLHVGLRDRAAALGLIDNDEQEVSA